MRLKGSLIEWNDSRGFGYLEPAGGGERLFCHISAFAVKVRRPLKGERFTYEVSKDERGVLRATQIRPADIKLIAKPAKTQKSPLPIGFRDVCIAIFFAFVIYLSWSGKLPWFVPLIYPAVSIATVLAYASDKSAAVSNRSRIKG